MTNLIINTLLILNAINNYRFNYCIPLLEYDINSEAIANKSAILFANQNNFNNSQYINGKNIAIVNDTTIKNDKTDIVINTINSFYNQHINYDYSNPRFNYNTSSFTQLVWSSTSKCGVAIAKNSKNQLIIVIQFSQSGNIKNQYSTNVLLPCTADYFPSKSPILKYPPYPPYPPYPSYPKYPPYPYPHHLKKKFKRKII